MNIGIVCYPTYGGSGVVATELGKALGKRGHGVHFISYREPVRLNNYDENTFFHEVRLANYPLFEFPPYEVGLTSKLVDVVEHEKLDILHVHYAIPHASAAYMAQQILLKKGIILPFVTTLHGTDITLVGKDQSLWPVINFAINQSSAVTAVSNYLKEATLSHFDIERDIKVVPNFICPEQYQSAESHLLKERYAPNGEKLIMHVSNFRKVKRVDDVLRVFARIRETLPAKLIMIGDGPERSSVESLCRELGTCDDTVFLGKVRGTETMLADADLFLLPSETESFGLAALEALAAGVPVVSSNTGGLTEVNEHGYSGFVAPVGDVESMANYSLDILSDPDTHAVFRKNAYNKSKQFHIDKILPVYEEMYEHLVAHKSLV
jgi:N-acetyl-alpha-D-glucosaminyl L-malate synthase BshA